MSPRTTPRGVDRVHRLEHLEADGDQRLDGKRTGVADRLGQRRAGQSRRPSGDSSNGRRRPGQWIRRPGRIYPRQHRSYVFAGPTAHLHDHDRWARVAGATTASLGLNTGSPQLTDVGLCYQSQGGGALTNFAGNGFSTAYFTTTGSTFTAAATKVVPAATYVVGMCIRNNYASAINNSNIVNGWFSSRPEPAEGGVPASSLARRCLDRRPRKACRPRGCAPVGSEAGRHSRGSHG
jgi:hypothetical protein